MSGIIKDRRTHSVHNSRDEAVQAAHDLGRLMGGVPFWVSLRGPTEAGQMGIHIVPDGTPPMTPDKAKIAEIAAGLTKAQRTACWNMSGEWDHAPHDGWRRAGQAASNLCRAGLAEKHPLGGEYTNGSRYRLTPLGVAVRHFLQEQSHDD